MSAFNNKTLMITGGTGSFGHAVLKHFLTSDIGQIRIFSRDEKKQDDMRQKKDTQNINLGGYDKNAFSDGTAVSSLENLFYNSFILVPHFKSEDKWCQNINSTS